jgi:glycosyltransferase involved in cell wall biosynthesis
MPTVLHVLRHPGGGAEAYIDLLEDLHSYDSDRIAFSPARSRYRSAALVPLRWPRIARAARHADLIHAHGDTAATLAIPLLRGRPSVVTTHGLHWFRRRGSGAVARRALNAAIVAASATICTTAAERDELRAVLQPEAAARLVAIPNGVPLPPVLAASDRERARAKLGVPAEALVALFAGRLEARKEPLLAVDAALRAREAGAPIVLLVAGDGPLGAEVAARSGPAVRPLGHSPDLTPLFAACDMFVLPSTREGMSMALLEAMGHGRAVVVADSPGNVEAVGDAGLVAGQSGPSFADAMQQLADPALRTRLATAARERIAEELTADRFLARTRDVYQRAMEGARQGA